MECDAGILPHHSNLNLFSLTSLRLLLGNKYAVDGILITTILKKCPNLQNLSIKGGEEYAHINNFPEVLQHALLESCPNLAKLKMNAQDNFSRLTLPDFVQETSSETLVWRKVNA